LHADALDRRNPAVRFDHPHRVGQGHDLDAFLPALVNLFCVGRHLRFAAAVNDERLSGPAAQSGSDRIHGHIAAADDRHPVAQVDAFTQVGAQQKVHTGPDPFDLFSLDAQQFALLGADGHEKGAVSLVAQIADGRVRTNIDTGFKRYSQFPQDRNLLVDDVPGQAVGRDAQGQHAAQDIVFFENRDGKSLDGQKPGAGQAGRPAAHHGHFLFPVLFFFWDRGNSVFPGPVGQKTMQGHDGDGCIYICPGAGGFAGVVADPAADAGKGVLAAEQFEGLLVFALGHQGHAALETGVGRAGGLAGCRSLFLDGVGRWHGLGVALEGGFAGAQALVEVVGHVDGADLAAFAAGGTTFHIDEAWPLAQGGGEVARLAGDGLYIGHGVQVDVQVAAGLHQLGGNDTHGAVVGREGLVQLGHDAADGRTLFCQDDPVAGIGQIQRCLNAGNAAADDQYGADGLLLHILYTSNFLIPKFSN
jgi:hypothetical protein